MSALCNRVYNRDEYLKEFRNNVMPDDFEVSVEVIKPGFIPKYIKKASILGKSEKLDLNVYEIIYDSTSDPRIGLTRDAFRLMSGYNSNQALMFFVPENDPSLYRLSLVTVEPKLDDKGIKVKYEYSNPRRYSFLLGETAKTQTPKRYLFNKGVIKDEKDLFERFNIEVVNKDFFTNIARLFTELVGGKRKFGSHEEDFKPLMKLPSTKDENVYKEFAVRLIGRTVFTWFLKKKVSDKGVPLIPDDLLSLYRVNKTKNFYHSILEPLFFELLNTETDKRKKPFRTKEFDLIPFLNGGLFEPKTEDFYELDDLQKSSKYTNTLVIPDEWFVQFFELLETYNFTLDESSSIDVELSVDPEMLGRIFENLLAEINPETGESARKSTGSFYTPRQIVDYMVDRSLSYYLASKTKIEQPKIDELLKYDTDKFDLTVEQIKKITDAIYSLKVLDPACGSGAFPMGMLNKIMMVLDKFDESSFDFISRYLDEIKDKKDRVAEEKRLYNKDWRYKHKLSVIRNSIYGVDIQPIAADISKLRFFLSLVVDEKINDSEDNRGVLPLPNLEFKFAIANTLISLPKREHGSIVNLFQDDTEANLKKLIKEYFESSSEMKEKIKKKISELQAEMVRNTIQWKDTSSSYFHLSDFKPFENKPAHWFEPEWMFGLQGGEGFDIVIGNPPWGQKSIKFTKDEIDYYKKTYPSTSIGIMDIFRPFIERGISLLKSNGSFSYVLPDIILLKNYDSTRKYILDNLFLTRIDHWGMAFDNVNLESCTLIGYRSHASKNDIICKIHTDNECVENIISKNKFYENDGYKFNLTLTDHISSILEKLKKLEKFSDYFQSHEGIHTGNIRNKLFIERKINSNCKKLVIGRNEISRYDIRWNGMWVNYDKSIINKSKNEYAGLGKDEYFQQSKLVVRRTGDYILAALDENRYYFSNNVFVCIPKSESNLDIKYVLGILNSKISTWYYRTVQPRKGKLFAELKINVLNQIPIVAATPMLQKEISDLVSQIIEKKQVNNKADTSLIEKEIDNILFKVYGLTKRESDTISQ